MTSAIFELIVFSLPSLFWMRRLRRGGSTPDRVRAAAGLMIGSRSGYGLAAALVVPVAALGTVLLATIPTHLLTGGSRNVVGVPHTAGDYLAIVLLAAAEEMLFRGFVYGVLVRRLGFARGNTLQALIFLAPHTLLLAVSVSLWSLLPLQLVMGWVLGVLRRRTGSLGPGWFAHAATNLIPALLLGLYKR